MTDAPPPTVDKRRAWFKESGYTGEENTVVLRTGQVAKPDDVWAVLEGLRNLRQAYPALFIRVGVAVVGDRTPYDPAGHLSTSEFGDLTTGRGTSKNWTPGRQKILLALLDVVDTDEVRNVEFANTPLETPMSEAA